MKFNDREAIIELTPLWKGERFPDGRPKVPQKYLDEMRKKEIYVSEKNYTRGI